MKPSTAAAKRVRSSFSFSSTAVATATKIGVAIQKAIVSASGIMETAQ